MRETAAEKVAIIMPAYNAALYIGAAIQSVLNQAHSAWELWILDDGSTDDTALQVQKFKDARIHFHQISHLGSPSQVRNLGSRLAHCTYLLFLDADDSLTPHALSESMALMGEAKKNRLVYGFLTAIDASGNPARSAGFKLVPANNTLTGFRLPSTYDHSPQKVILAQICISTTFLIKREFFEALGGFDETLSSSEDLDLFFRAFLEEWDSICALPAYMVRYRKNTSSLTRSPKNFERILNSQLQATQKFLSHTACPQEAINKAPEAFMRRYSYVSGLCLEQGHRFQAFKFCLLACKHPAITLNAWLKHGLSLIFRALLLPHRLDCYLKELAVQCRDGLWQERLKRKSVPQEPASHRESYAISTGI